MFRILPRLARESSPLRLKRLADAAFEGLVVVRDNRIQDANAAFRLMAAARTTDLLGEPLIGGLVTFDSEAEGQGEDRRREGWLNPLDGSARMPVEIYCRQLDEEDEAGGSLVVLALRDMSERRAAEAKIRYLAEHDGLTGLLNRNALSGRLAAALERVRASGEGLAVLHVDLDHFKESNDVHGHTAGDAVLIETGKRLQACIEAPSFAARLGADEFVIVQVGAGQPGDAAAELAAKLSVELSQPVVFEGQDLPISASFGISLFPEDGEVGEALITNADMALFRAKEAGGKGWRFFKREMDDNIRERRNLARELRQAISDGELLLHYQPLARACDIEVCGFEALVRWQHPVRGMIPPGDFISIAEECGLIVPLGDWVLRRACQDAAAWARPLRVAVNLSPLQLNQPHLPTVVQQVLIDTGLPPSRLELEITETGLFKDYQRALDNLRRLKALGVRIAMDDFGTGFSSLSTLQSFPFDKIKIDRSFVNCIHTDQRATVIVRAVLGLGRSLEIPVVAEGVETQEQLDFLRNEACAEVQGYKIGRPAPIDSVAEWTQAVEAVVEQPRRRRKSAA